MMLQRLTRKGQKPVLLNLRSSTSLIVTTAAFAVFTDIFLYAVIVPVLPFSLTTRAGVDQERVQYWVSISLAVYGAALLIASPFWGYLADRIRNRKIPMLVGLLFLLGATIFLCLANSIAMFIVGRILQGLSAALTWTVGLALVVDTVDSTNVGVAMGWIGSAASFGVLIAPLLGGVVYGKGGYYSVFAMCFGLLAVDIFLRLAIIEVKEAKKWLEPEEQREREPPTAQQQTTTTTQTANHDTSSPPEGVDQSKLEKGHAAAESNQQPGEASPRQGGFKAAIGPFLGLLKQPRLLAALWGTLVHSILQTSFDSTLPLFVESTFHWDSIGAGLIFLPLVLPEFLGPVVGMFADKFGPKWFAAVGFAFATPFLVCLRFVDNDSMAHKIMLCGLLTGVGIAIVLVFGPLMAEITWSVTEDTGEEGEGDAEDEDAVPPYAQAYGLYNMAFSGGAVVGPLIGGLIRDSAGWPTLGWVLALTTGVTAVTQMLWIGGPLTFKKK